MSQRETDYRERDRDTERESQRDIDYRESQRHREGQRERDIDYRERDRDSERDTHTDRDTQRDRHTHRDKERANTSQSSWEGQSFNRKGDTEPNTIDRALGTGGALPPVI